VSLEKKGPDWAGAGWNWSGGDDDRIRVPRPTTILLAKAEATYKLIEVKDLEEIQKVLEAAHAAFEDTPDLEEKKFEELAAELFILREKHSKLGRDYWHNLVRAFAAGVIVAWIAWTIFGGPS